MTGNTLQLNNLMTSLQKEFGPNKVMWASEVTVGPPISTGSLALDFATGYGGFPSNRLVEICGREQTGKTTLALLTMVNALEKNPNRGAMFLDVEHKITESWMEMIVGKELMAANRIFYGQPDSIEEATNVYRRGVTSGMFCCAVLDSIGGAPTVRRSDDAETGHYGGNAQGVGEFGRSAAACSSVYNCLTIGINQTREDLSGRGKLNRPGGTAWKHAIVMCVELWESNKPENVETALLSGSEKTRVPVGKKVFGKIRKNQVAAPGRTASWWFYNIWTAEHGFGIDHLDEVRRLGVATGVLEQRGSWYHHPALPEYTNDKKGEHKVQGQERLKELIYSDESLRETLTSEVLAGVEERLGDIAPMSDPNERIEISAQYADFERPRAPLASLTSMSEEGLIGPKGWE